MFIDSIVISVASGKGGDGMVHMHREKYRPRGGPDGGDGGRGGNVTISVSPTLNALNRFRPNERFEAENGKNGGANNCSGRAGKDLTLYVPPGTAVYNDETAELISDMLGLGQSLVVLKGGRGGRGNQHFATSRNQMPLTAERGEPGAELTLRLELKLIADVGLVGMPNAGKSSILAAVTNARPKIDNYPFTTLEPHLGVARLDDEHTLVLADIPGLIEGASEGAGLGFDFLRHIERTRMLVHVLDGWSEDPLGDYETINAELDMYSERLAGLPQIVVLNKADLPETLEKYAKLKPVFAEKGIELGLISAVTHSNLRDLLWQLWQRLQELPNNAIEEVVPVYRADEDPNAFELEHEGDAWYLSGRNLERAAAMTYFDQPGSVRRFQRYMGRLGVEKALRQAGIQEGDRVVIGEWELEWQD